MSAPIVTGCGEAMFDFETCAGQVLTYYSVQQTVSCPAGFLGTFTSSLGKFTSVISQADADAKATAYLNNLLATSCVQDVFTPVVSNGSANIGNNIPFSYQIIATNSPTIYGATGLPTGLSINTSTGLITGTATGMTVGHVYSIAISATNVAGTGTGILTITVKTPIVFTLFIDSGFPSSPASVQVSVDGGSYMAGVNGTYTAINQIKWKSSIPNSTHTLFNNTLSCSVGGSRILASGSSVSASGNITVAGDDAWNQYNGAAGYGVVLPLTCLLYTS